MRVLVSGATSFIGLPLSQKLLEDGHEVIALIRKNSPKKSLLPINNRIKTIELDMEEYEDINTHLATVIDVVFALSWDGTRGADRNNDSLQKKSHEQNMTLLKQAESLNCKKFITAGSQAEYGPWFQVRKETEMDIPHPNTEYGKYKLKFFEDASLFCRNHQIILMEPRFFSLYGPGDYAGTLIMSMLENMKNHLPCDLTECKQIWDFLYIDDAIRGLVCLMGKGESGIYNFGSGESAPLFEYVETMYRLTQSKSQLRYGAVPYPKTGMVNTNPEVSKLKALGWKPEVRFEDGIQRILSQMM